MLGLVMCLYDWYGTQTGCIPALQRSPAVKGLGFRVGDSGLRVQGDS